MSSRDHLLMQAAARPAARPTPPAGRARAAAAPVRSAKRHDPETPLLPDELLLAIFQRLAADGVMTCARVCRQWARVARDPGVWAAVYRHKYPTTPPPAVALAAGIDWQRLFVREALARRRAFLCRGLARPAFVAQAKKLAALPTFSGMVDYQRLWTRLDARVLLALVDARGDELTLTGTAAVFDTVLHVQWTFDYPAALGMLRDAVRVRVRVAIPVFAWEAPKPNVKPSRRRADGPHSHSLLAEGSLARYPGALVTGDRHLALHVLPLHEDELIVGLFVAAGTGTGRDHTAFIAWQAPFGSVFPRVMAGCAHQLAAVPRPKIPPSHDVDAIFGLHDFSVRLTLRSFARELYTFEFTHAGVTPARPPTVEVRDGVPGVLLTLLAPGSRTHLLSTAEPLALPWQAGPLAQTLPAALVCDVQVTDEFENLFACGSRVVVLRRAPETYMDFAHAGACYQIAAPFAPGNTVHLRATVVDADDGLRFLYDAVVWLALPAVDAWFGTTHTTSLAPPARGAAGKLR